MNQNGENNELEDNDNGSNIDKKNTDIIILGPYRVSPGNLSVSRTIGDPFAKLLAYGGNSKVVISEPDIFCFDLEKDDIDFIILGCDGIYDQLTSQEILESAWKMIEKNRKNNVDIYNTCANIVDFILKMSMARKSFDNVTCLMIAFKDLLNINKTEENKNSKEEDKSEEKLPNIGKDKAFSMIENNESNKNKFHIDKDKKMLNIKSLKISKDKEGRNRKKINSEELSQIIKNNILLSKESKLQENDENDFLKYKHKHKLALSLKKEQNSKEKNLSNNINNNYFLNKNNNNLSLKKPKINLNLAKNFLNNKFKPAMIDSAFWNNNKNKYINNLALKLNSNTLKNYSDVNHIKKEELYINSITNNNKEKEINYIQNYNSKEKKHSFPNKPHLNNINIKNTKNKNKILLSDLFFLDNEYNSNKNIRLKTLNKKSISYYNNGIDDINKNKLKKHQNKYSFQKYNNTNNNLNDLYNMNHINSRNLHSELKSENTDKLKKNMKITNLIHNANDEKMKLTIKSIFKEKNLNHNLTDDFSIDNKKK